MKGLIAFFFPAASEYHYIAGVCYALVFIAAYKRFDSLTMNYGSYDAPDSARPWTTYLRYHAAAAIYSSLYAVFLAVIYQILLRYPVLIDAAKTFAGENGALGQFLSTLDTNENVVSPILALVLLTLGADRYRKSVTFDKKLRYYFQKLGSIPSAVSLTVRKLKKYKLKINSDECAAILSDDIKREILHPKCQEDPRSLEYLYLRACQLYKKIEHWTSIDSDFFQFQVAYNQAFGNIKSRFEEINRKTNRYYQLKLKCAGDAQLCAQIYDEATSEHLNSMYPKVLTELRKDLKNDLKNILENIYIFIACAIQSRALGARRRKKLMESFGFVVEDSKRTKGDGVDPNDLSILAIFIVFVVPLSAVLTQLANIEQGQGVSPITYVVWTCMTLFIGLTSVAIPIIVKNKQEDSNLRFWSAIRPQKGHPWASYLVAGLLSGIAGVIGMFSLQYLDPFLNKRSVIEALTTLIPWGLVPMSISITLGYHLYRRRPNGKGNRVLLLEIWTTALFTVVAAALALTINTRANPNDLVLSARTCFSLCGALLLGSIIGAVVPYRYRKQREKMTQVKKAQVDLKDVIACCLHHHSERANKENIRINSIVSADMPVLHADQDKIEFAINGLLSNAVEFTPRGGQITVTAKSNGGGTVTFAVKDNGIGMSMDKIETILKAPSRTVQSAWEQLGETVNANLVQVRAVAEKHGGSIDLKSEQWEGTTVTMVLPQNHQAAQTANMHPLPPQGTENHGSLI